MDRDWLAADGRAERGLSKSRNLAKLDSTLGQSDDGAAESTFARIAALRAAKREIHLTGNPYAEPRADRSSG